ncbi:ABC transporter substrate-binding protein [Streptomyces sioyaensis]|uniref:ABC transporter substrate-binding protein n=1 Tax=Streptomyces sioyaensis TaxID=67364 RepID=UPI00378C29BE
MTKNESTAQQGVSRRRFLAFSALAGAGSLVAACGGTGIGGGGGTGAVTWGSWANPGEAKRFREYSQAYQKKSGVRITYQTVVGDYKAKLLSQLAGGSAPDVFYVGDDAMAKLIGSGQLVDLAPALRKSDSPVKESEFFPGLMEWCRPAEGGGLFGLPVDCNPAVFWFNSDVLAKAGVSQTPAEMFKAGTWDQNALTSMLEKIRASGKRGLVIESAWFNFFGWMTTFGGTLFDDDGGAVFDTDPKAQAALEWMFDQLKSGNITYGGSLPKGQGVDALFYSGQLATIQYGRWILPNMTKLDFTYDIAPLPSESGKDIMPVPVATAAIAVNAKAKDKAAALDFVLKYVSKEGQGFRLSGGGNAVPSINGLDKIVTEEGVPRNARLFTEIARKGYAIPQAIAHNPTVATKFPLLVDRMLKDKATTARSFSRSLVKLLNGEG